MVYAILAVVSLLFAGLQWRAFRSDLVAQVKTSDHSVQPSWLEATYTDAVFFMSLFDSIRPCAPFFPRAGPASAHIAWFPECGRDRLSQQPWDLLRISEEWSFHCTEGRLQSSNGCSVLANGCMVISEMHLYNIYMHGELNDHQVPSIKDCRSSLEEFHMQLVGLEH